MKKSIFLITGIYIAFCSIAQTDTSNNVSAKERDTIRIGNMIIIKKKKEGQDSANHARVKIYKGQNNNKPLNLTTNWFIPDIGFTNYDDQTNYAMAQTSNFVASNINEEQLNLRAGKSVNVNFWFFLQKLNIIKHVVNLKYGIGVELNNYRFNEDIQFQKNPTMVILNSGANYRKNKLAADYVTVPLMLSFNFTPQKKRELGFSIGVSAGYLYSARQKFKEEPERKYRVRDDFDLRPIKISYIGELGLGFVKLYGSYATRSIFKKGLDITPYTIGIRLSYW